MDYWTVLGFIHDFLCRLLPYTEKGGVKIDTKLLSRFANHERFL